MTNYLYLVTRKDDIDYDEYMAFVVCAKDKKEVKEIISFAGYYSWEISQIGKSYLNKAKIVLGSFRAG